MAAGLCAASTSCSGGTGNDVDAGPPRDGQADVADADPCAAICDDGDPCTADTCDGDGQCVNTPDDSLCVCPELGGGSCSSVEPASVSEHHMQALDSCSFALRKVDDHNTALIDEVADVAGGYTSLQRVLGDLNRAGVSSISAKNADRLKNHVVEGFQWNAGDNATTSWYPQGITGGSDAEEDGKPLKRRLVLVAWYDHTGNTPSKGVRISLADISNLKDVHYRHLLLVTPTGTKGAASFKAANYGSGSPLHAGGIVWIGNLLYVAVTGDGFRVYDMSRIIKATNYDDKTRIGRVGNRIDAHGYKYIVPQIAHYGTPPEACDVRFSFVGLDRSAKPATIISGEYHASDAIGRLVSWPIDTGSGWLIEDARGDVRNVSSVAAAQTRMQGGLTYNGNYYISCSSQISGGYGRLYRTRPGRTSSITAWIYGAEDLYLERDSNRIWTDGEQPTYRDVVSVVRQNP